jgi:hypothetical protein
MAQPDLTPDDLLRGLARLLAPYLADELRGTMSHHAPRKTVPPRRVYDDAGARDFVADLPLNLTENALVLFEALKDPPHRIDAPALVELLGAVNGRELSGLLTTPLKRRATKLGFGDPPWTTDESGTGHTVWLDRDGDAERIYQALTRRLEELRQHEPRSAHALLAHPDTRRPVPSSVYVWAPEYADYFTEAKKDEIVGASCLRSDRPGTRAVIYRAHEDRGIVALFDVGLDPEPDPEWGWHTEGHFHLVEPKIDRSELLQAPELDRVFAHIQNRRRIPAGAQQQLKDLLVKRFPEGQLPLFRPLQTGRKRRR